MATINFEGLSSAAKRWDPVLRTLPFRSLNETAKKMRLNIINVKSGEHIIKNMRRNAGIVAPYSPGLTLDQSKELMKFLEASLKPEIVFANVPDNVTNYEEMDIISSQGNAVDNKTKKHPLEYLILRNLVTSFSEDISFNLFTAQRDESVLSPATAFNGFNYKLSVLRTALEISAANKNLVNSGEFGTGTAQAPVDDYQKLVDWLRQANFFLRKGEVILYASEHVMNNVRKSYKDRVKAFMDPTFEDTVRLLRSDANMPALQIITEPEFGSGSQLILIKPGMLDVGTRNATDQQFVSVRNVKDDPNEVSFWVQAAYDTRIVDIHPKVFMMNEFINTVEDLAGDYLDDVSPETVALNLATASLGVGNSLQLTAVIAPNTATDKSLIWTTSNAAVAVVNQNGLVTGVSAGTANITAKTKLGEKVASCAVTVAAVATSGVVLDKDAASVAAGQTLQLNAVVAPANATNKDLTWSSDTAAVATVSDEGLVTAVAQGTAVITVTTAGNQTDTCTITVP